MKSFTELNLSPAVSQSIQELGYTTPSEIQARALPILLGEPTDFIGLAATGTGKTAAFGIPLVEQIEAKRGVIQAIILCPTRELAMQVSGQINLLGKHKGVRSQAVYGGASFGDQVKGLRQGANIVVGTPGRICDHIDRGTLKLDQISKVVLDEADEMITMGFKDDLEKILSSTPRETSNIWLFSATMSREVRKVADDYLRDPAQVEINRTEVLAEGVEQLYYMTSESNKPEVLCKLMDVAPEFYGLIFCQTKALVVDLTQYLTQRGYRVDSLHGDKDQTERERTLKGFRERRTQVLVCTDVASRGLDVKDITHVINYSLPRELDSYVHRIGRTARSGKTGFAISLVTSSHRGLIGRIERATKSRMKEGRIPTRKDVGMKKLANILPKFQEQSGFARALELMSPEWKQAIAAMSAEEIAARFLALSNPDVFAEREAQDSSDDYTPRQPNTARGVGKVVVRGRTESAPASRPTPSGKRGVSPVQPISGISVTALAPKAAPAAKAPKIVPVAAQPVVEFEEEDEGSDDIESFFNQVESEAATGVMTFEDDVVTIQEIQDLAPPVPAEDAAEETAAEEAAVDELLEELDQLEAVAEAEAELNEPANEAVVVAAAETAVEIAMESAPADIAPASGLQLLPELIDELERPVRVKKRARNNKAAPAPVTSGVVVKAVSAVVKPLDKPKPGFAPRFGGPSDRPRRYGEERPFTGGGKPFAGKKPYGAGSFADRGERPAPYGKRFGATPLGGEDRPRRYGDSRPSGKPFAGGKPSFSPKPYGSRPWSPEGKPRSGGFDRPRPSGFAAPQSDKKSAMRSSGGGQRFLTRNER